MKTGRLLGARSQRHRCGPTCEAKWLNGRRQEALLCAKVKRRYKALVGTEINHYDDESIESKQIFFMISKIFLVNNIHKCNNG